MRTFSIFSIAASLLGASACGEKSGSDESSASASAGSGEASGSTDTTESSSEGVTAPEDCEDITDEAECLAAPGGEFGCDWRVGIVATREGDVCEVSERGVCIGGEWGNTAAGCGELAGCEGSEFFSNPYYQELPEGLLLLDFCGGSPPASFMPCSSGEAAADPAACACACELAPMP